jgi:NADPH:quinone reductase
MRAFVVKELTHPSKISLSTGIPEPTAGPGQVLVDVYSAGLNFFEVDTLSSMPHPDSAQSS